MKINKMLYVAGLLALTACSNNESIRQQDNDLQLLQLTASQQGMVSEKDAVTRAADGIYDAAFDGGEQVKVWFNSTSAVYFVGEAGTDNRSTLYGGSLAYPVTNTGTMPLYAVYPATSVAGDSPSHTVAADQSQSDLGTANYKASDLMYANGDVDLTVANRYTAVQDLTFGHQLVKLKLVVTKGSDLSAVTQVKVTGVKRTVALTPSASVLTQGDLSSADDNDNIVVFSGSNTSLDAQTYCCVFPAQAWNDADFVVVTADGQDITYRLTKTKDEWANGHEYTLNLDVTAASLGMAVTIDNWTPDGTVTTYTANRFVIGDIEPQTLVNGVAEPQPTVHYNGTLLTLGTDYTLAYANNTAVGENTATVYVVGKGSLYAGKSASKTFTIIADANPEP